MIEECPIRMAQSSCSFFQQSMIFPVYCNIQRACQSFQCAEIFDPLVPGYGASWSLCIISKGVLIYRAEQGRILQERSRRCQEYTRYGSAECSYWNCC